MKRCISSRLSAYIECRLWRLWQCKSAPVWALLPFSCVFGLLAALRRASFKLGWRRIERVPLPIVVVGNLIVGGAGKTPTVIALIEALRAVGFNPGVIARGYGARIKQPCAVVADSVAAEVGDEPLLIARRTLAPVWVCADRAAAARALCAARPDIDLIISDDGLQHYRLARNVELVVFDYRLGGNGFLLPAGPLREPLTRRRDATLINDTSQNLSTNCSERTSGGEGPGLANAAGTGVYRDVHEDSCYLPTPHHARAVGFWTGSNTFALKCALGDAWRLNNPGRRCPLIQFAGERISAVAGIGSPERFFSMLRACGLALTTYVLPDHFDYMMNPFLNISADVILMTEKDAVKCDFWRDERLWAVPLETTLDARLITLIVEKIRGCPPT